MQKNLKQILTKTSFFWSVLTIIPFLHAPSYATTYVHTKINNWAGYSDRQWLVADNKCYMCSYMSNLECADAGTAGMEWLNGSDAVSATSYDTMSGMALPSGRRTTITCNRGSEEIIGYYTRAYTFATGSYYSIDKKYIVAEDMVIMCADMSIGGYPDKRYDWFNDGDTVTITNGSGIGISGSVTLQCDLSGDAGFTIQSSCAAGKYGASTCYTCPTPGTSSTSNNTAITGCYIPSYASQSSTKGTYRYTTACYYSL